MERPPLRRRRPALACIQCRRRKVKCDRSDPCTQCSSTNSQCTYRGDNAESAVGLQREPTLSPPVPVPSPSLGSENASINRQAAESSSSIPRPRPVAVTIQQAYTPSSLGRNDTHPSGPAHEPEPSVREVLQQVQNCEESLVSRSIHGLSETSRDILERQSGLQNSDVILNKTRILGWSQWMGTAHEYSLIGACYIATCGGGEGGPFEDPEIQVHTTQMGILLQKCKEIARAIKMERPSRSISGPGFSLELPSRGLADTVARQYFGSFESTHRILHIPTFWAEYQRYWDQPESVKTDIRLKLLLVLGIGSSLSEHGHTDPGFRSMVHRWIYAAEAWLSGPLEKDRLSITGLQIHCLAMIARQIFSVGGDLVWVSMGSLTQQAMQVGLHRDPKHLPEMSILQAELRRRLWATILELLVQSSLDSAMPPRISFDDFDTASPSNLNDEEIDNGTMDRQSHPKNVYTTTSMQLILYETLPTRLRVVHRLNGLHSQLSYVDVLALSSELDNAYQTCNKFLKENESEVTPFHRNMMDYLVRRFLIPLHSPFASQAHSNPLYYYSLKTSLDTAMAIVSSEPDEGFSNIMTIAGGLFREGLRYSFSVVSQELIAQTVSQHRDGTLHRNTQYRQMLKQAMSQILSLSTERIRKGETNVKSHMFLNMVLAQIEALETGTPCEYKMAQSGRESLEFCHDILQTLLTNVSSPSINDTGVQSDGFDIAQGDYGLDLDLDFFFPNAGF